MDADRRSGLTRAEEDEWLQRGVTPCGPEIAVRPVPTVASMEQIWRVARVDKGVVRLLRDGGESVTGGSMTAPTLRDGTLPDVTGRT